MKTLKYILLSSILLITPVKAMSQNNIQGDTVSCNLLDIQGLSVSTDIFGYAYSLLEDYTSGEVSVELNLGNKYYPVVEMGYGTSDYTDETYGIHYKSSAPYFRVGLNYNFNNKKGEAPRKSYIYGLARVGWTKPKYDVSAPPMTDPVWGGTVPLDITDAQGSFCWFELGIGVKVNIWKNFSMGWSIRYKARMHKTGDDNSYIWYAPGFGNSRHTTFGGTYNLTYDLPL